MSKTSAFLPVLRRRSFSEISYVLLLLIGRIHEKDFSSLPAIHRPESLIEFAKQINVLFIIIISK